MSHLYGCEDQLCQNDQDLHSFGEIIEHLRTKRKLSFKPRPQSMGISDIHGQVWYCFHCGIKTGKDHGNFQSNEAMWDRLNDLHNHQLDKIKPEE